MTAAEQLPPKESQVRRLALADLNEKNLWIVNRILKLYTNQNTRSIFGWLREVIDNNEFCCLYQPHAVAFAERVSLDRLSGKLLVREIFVWCENPDNAEQQLAACEFYRHFADWARWQNIDKMIVLERSDVPPTMVRDALGGRLHEIKTNFVRV